jgi:hypothetical protein
MIAFPQRFWIILLPTLCFGIDERPYVTCEIRSQLGNHLFEVATTLEYAWDYDVQPLFPGLQGARNNQKHIFFRLDHSQIPYPPTHSFFPKILCLLSFPIESIGVSTILMI